MSKKKLFASFALFVGLAGAGLWYAAGEALKDAQSLKLATELPTSLLSAMFAWAVLVYAADIIRFKLFGKLAGVRVALWPALEASVVNLFFGWITPGAAMGAPAAVYTLGKRGVPWDASMVVCFGKSLTGFGVLLILAFSFLAFGMGPSIDNPALLTILASAALISALFIAAPVLGGFHPERSKKVLDKIKSATQLKIGKKRFEFLKLGFVFDVLLGITQRMAFLKNQNKFLFLAALSSQLLYFCAFIAPAVMLCRFYGAEFMSATAHSTLFTALAYSAPTPGGAGIAEASSVMFFKDIISPAQSLYVGGVFRAFTFYFQIAAGAAYFFVFGGLGAVLAGNDPAKNYKAGRGK